MKEHTIYDTKLSEQLARFVVPEEKFFNPLNDGFFSLAKKRGEIPLWGISFSEKSISPLSQDTYTAVITDEVQLQAMDIDEELSLIEVEREIVVDSQGDTALVERVYAMPKIDTTRARELKRVTTLVKEDHFGGRLPIGQFHAITQTPEMSDADTIGGTTIRIADDDLRILLSYPNAIIII